ncbi:Transcription factor iws1 [Exophiala dermatitidis]|uniref:Transcription factor iws1 n=1 Tax=Exophiala dermatitidis TaxID=5970 RepID=A0AAN6EN10_EXODE|nr:Transcription factor iws1 [Exophiala dermatitidis]KAJ4510896.1 Transcription factor iws1 [Exophiala dermatitidis]KAJ4513291.1 Transcription factor iws1 [Exophiala dermatitidis]KAJ4538158.1 Transcription factor iws1 [Exophiala dermatitidis]KAJ4539893.1 Transcription factor iws1 [Exophiala dermatitidis]
MSDYGEEQPPADAEGLDRPSENEDQLDDLNDEFNDPSKPAQEQANNADDSDDESLLSEVDEAQFADFDPTNVQVAPDFDTLNRSIHVKKRKRTDGEDAAPKKKKEKTRERARKNRRRQDSDEGFSGGEEIEGKRVRKAKDGDGERKKPARVEINEEDLTPEERRRRALDRAMDAAVKRTQGKRVRKGEIDLEQAADQEIEDLRNRMIAAAETDGELVRQGLPASQKLKMLPEVVSLLNRNNIVQSILDPETNLLEAVRFFLEPLTDGSLPAYNIQRELFAALAKLPMNKETLISSGIGKVILFYRRSKRAEPAIKRQATKLMEEWSRPILQRSDDYTKKNWARAAYDPTKKREDLSQPTAVPKIKNNLAPGQKQSNRARLLPGATSYTIVPEVSTIVRR